MSTDGDKRTRLLTILGWRLGRVYVISILAVVLAIGPVFHAVTSGTTSGRTLNSERGFAVATHDHDHDHEHGSDEQERDERAGVESFSLGGHGHIHDHGGLEHTHELASEPVWPTHPAIALPRMCWTPRAMAPGVFDLSNGLERPPRSA